MEWYHHALLYPQAIIVTLPSYIWKTIVGAKEFVVDVQNTKEKMASQYEALDAEYDDESESDEEKEE